MLTAEIVRELLVYNPETGFFYRKRKTGNSEFYKKVSGYINSKGYRTIQIYHKRYLVHRVIWLYLYGEWPENIDHINHVRDDNRISNLRLATSLINSQNQKLRKNNKSGSVGISYRKRDKVWQASVTYNRIKYHLGHFHSLEAAIAARNEASKKYGFHPNHGTLNESIPELHY